MKEPTVPPAEQPRPSERSRQRPVGIVLAGGSSRRLGADKALLPYRGGTLLQWTRRRLAAVCDEVLVADRGRIMHDGTSIGDGPGAGPAAGVLGAAAARPGRSLLVLACDLPAVPAALLDYLWRRATDGAWDWVVPGEQDEGGEPGTEGVQGVQPLCAVYGPQALRTLEHRVERGRLSLHGLLDEPALRILHVAGDELAAFGREESLFRNLNTAADVELWQAFAAASRARVDASQEGSGSSPSRRRKSKR